MTLINDCNPQLRRLFSKLGWVDVAPVDAISATTRFPGDYTLTPWIRPAGTEYINVPNSWENLVASERIRLARETGAKIDPGLETAAQVAEADRILSEYLSNTKHPAA
jgi:hypothetical protein